PENSRHSGIIPYASDPLWPVGLLFLEKPGGASQNSRDPPHFAGFSPYGDADILPGRYTGARNRTTAHPRLTRQRLHCPRAPLPARTIPARLARVGNMVQRRLGPLQPSNSILVSADMTHQVKPQLVRHNLRSIRRPPPDQRRKPLLQPPQQLLLELQNLLFPQSLQPFTSASTPQPSSAERVPTARPSLLASRI